MKKEPWVAFLLFGWEEVAAYTLRGTFPGECEETRKLLAYEHGVTPDKITVVIEERYAGRRRTSA